MAAESMTAALKLKVTEGMIEDVGKGLARLDPGDLKSIGSVLGDVVEIIGGKKTVARVTGTLNEWSGKKIIQIDGQTRDNAKAELGSTVEIKK